MSDNCPTRSAPSPLLSVVMPGITVDGLPEPWPKLAICVGEDPDTFFPSHGETGARARHICANCPISKDCREYAIQADEFGIWGGLDQEERRALLIQHASFRRVR